MKRNSNHALRKIGGETLLVPIGRQITDTNGVITMNETAVFLWELLGIERSGGELISCLLAEFDIDEATARADVQSFVDEMSRLELLN